ncbi:hypothetical protein ACFL20_01000 [Spirochaetota bacterium]
MAKKSSAKSSVKPKAKPKTKPKVKTRAKTKVKAKVKPEAKPRAKAKAAPAKTTKKSKLKRKKNLSNLHSKMNKLSLDAVDREIIRRFKIVIDTCEEDITKISLDTILKNQKHVNVYSFHESLQPYIKHYLFMVKRSISKSKK